MTKKYCLIYNYNKQIEQDMQDLTIYDDLITSLITLKVVLEEIDKNSIVIDLEINNRIKPLEFLEEELKIAVLRNRFLGRPSNSIEEEIDTIEGLKEVVKWKSKGAKMLQDLNYEKSDQIAEIEKIELKLIRSGTSKELISFLKKSVVSKKY